MTTLPCLALADHVSPFDAVHWLVVTTKRARTGCGILTFGIGVGEAINHETGDSFRCTLDFYDGTVTCQRCLEAT